MNFDPLVVIARLVGAGKRPSTPHRCLALVDDDTWGGEGGRALGTNKESSRSFLWTLDSMFQVGNQ